MTSCGLTSKWAGMAVVGLLLCSSEAAFTPSSKKNGQPKLAKPLETPDRQPLSYSRDDSTVVLPTSEEEITKDIVLSQLDFTVESNKLLFDQDDEGLTILDEEDKEDDFQTASALQIERNDSVQEVLESYPFQQFSIEQQQEQKSELASGRLAAQRAFAQHQAEWEIGKKQARMVAQKQAEAERLAVQRAFADHQVQWQQAQRQAKQQIQANHLTAQRQVAVEQAKQQKQQQQAQKAALQRSQTMSIESQRIAAQQQQQQQAQGQTKASQTEAQKWATQRAAQLQAARHRVASEEQHRPKMAPEQTTMQKLAAQRMAALRIMAQQSSDAVVNLEAHPQGAASYSDPIMGFPKPAAPPQAWTMLQNQARKTLQQQTQTNPASNQLAPEEGKKPPQDQILPGNKMASKVVFQQALNQKQKIQEHIQEQRQVHKQAQEQRQAAKEVWSHEQKSRAKERQMEQARKVATQRQAALQQARMEQTLKDHQRRAQAEKVAAQRYLAQQQALQGAQQAQMQKQTQSQAAAKQFALQRAWAMILQATGK